jgi:amino-acid N-acetyltransferase
MDGPSVSLERATGDDLATVEHALAAADLPTSDLGDAAGRFYLAVADGHRVGVGGLEVYGTDGLLRSLAVPADARGEGYGIAICDALEAEARDAGVQRLYLLTTTAASFFEARGYERVDRATAPEQIQGTTQFAELCPSGATCLRRELPPVDLSDGTEG